ncbi:MAG: acetaldehyde dehydrogenase (acetylating) [Spirochaetota bacterium]
MAVKPGRLGRVAIVGPGNIGIDLMLKILKRSRFMELAFVVGIDPASEGLRMAAELGCRTSATGMEEMLADTTIRIVFEATSAKAHLANAPRYRAFGKKAIDLTPASVGLAIVPAVNGAMAAGADVISLVTCGGQATIPIVEAISSVEEVDYAEIVATIASRSAGPGTRQNIDEFTHTTARAIEGIGGAHRGKAIILLNPAEPPILMRNTIYASVKDPDLGRISESVRRRVREIQGYVPGYELILEPTFDGEKVCTMIQVRGAGDYLPAYAGNLDIMTSAALRIGDDCAAVMLGKGRAP